ncbi:tRNA(Ile)-lysidine synthase [Candidatus Mikella endobia]|uniref:tRNA(Ile)-lysidine synthase n=1 Tax=Candidatus Mikella endobia TaxID=1778264 RepID=A0A143WSV4_9ENTR|nr:tRNA lysidine(34) synthetase TilS [Candidatus Mikella endobia]CUX95959.1 tRNA(Ile)-lysidine synthase [Candidatus Mikella endobia]
MNYHPDEYVRILCNQLFAQLNNYKQILIAFSGGLDSTVLLDALYLIRDTQKKNNCITCNTQLRLRAVYINHGLSIYTNNWALHCASECRRRKIEFHTKDVKIVINSESIEAAARTARYQALAETITNDEVLLTAHNKDDQAETLLLALKRGSGPAGLAAMAENSPFYGSRLLRPLLSYSRQELEIYAKKRILCWIEDDSNNNLRFDRNFLRLQILPLLRKRWPRFVNTVVRSAKLCAEQEQLLDILLAETLAELIQPDGSLKFKKLIMMIDIKRAAILRRWLANSGVKMPTRKQLACIWQEVALSRHDAVAKIQIDHSLQVRRFRDCLYLIPILQPLSKNEIFYWNFKINKLLLPLGLGNLIRSTLPNNSFKDYLLVAVVRAPNIYEQVSIRFGSVSGLLYINGRRRGRKLKKIWQELAIPPWQRGYIPLLFYNEQLIAALGTFITWEGTAHDYCSKWYIFRQYDSYSKNNLS